MSENTIKDTVPPLTPASEIPPNLGPLNYAGSEIEEVLRLMFLDLFNEMVRPKLDELNTIGIPHRAPLPVVQQAIKLDGLALERPDADEAYIRQLYKSWRARNPRRGLSFITHYLQMLWPGLWQCKQLWQDPALPYPTGTVSQERPGYFLTSRVLVVVNLDDPSGAELEKMRGSLRSVLAARLVILVGLLRKFDGLMRMSCAFYGVDMVGVPAIQPPAPPTSFEGQIAHDESFIAHDGGFIVYTP